MTLLPVAVLFEPISRSTRRTSDGDIRIILLICTRIKFDAQLIPIKGSNDAHHNDADDTLALLTTTGTQALQVFAVEDNLINQRVIELIMLRAEH